MTRIKMSKSVNSVEQSWWLRFGRDPIGTLLNAKALWIAAISYGIPSFLLFSYLSSIGQSDIFLDVATSSRMVPISALFCFLSIACLFLALLPSIFAISLMGGIKETTGWKWGVSITGGVTVLLFAAATFSITPWIDTHVWWEDFLCRSIGIVVVLLLCSSFKLLPMDSLGGALRRRPLVAGGIIAICAIFILTGAFFLCGIVSTYSSIVVRHALDVTNTNNADAVSAGLYFLLATIMPVIPAWTHVLNIHARKPERDRYLPLGIATIIFALAMLGVESDAFRAIRDVTLQYIGVRTLEVQQFAFENGRSASDYLEGDAWHIKNGVSTDSKVILAVPIFKFDKWIVLCPVTAVVNGEILPGMRPYCTPLDRSQVRRVSIHNEVRKQELEAPAKIAHAHR